MIEHKAELAGIDRKAQEAIDKGWRPTVVEQPEVRVALSRDVKPKPRTLKDISEPVKLLCSTGCGRSIVFDAKEPRPHPVGYVCPECHRAVRAYLSGREWKPAKAPKPSKEATKRPARKRLRGKDKG